MFSEVVFTGLPEVPGGGVKWSRSIAVRHKDKELNAPNVVRVEGGLWFSSSRVFLGHYKNTLTPLRFARIYYPTRKRGKRRRRSARGGGFDFF